MSDSPTSSRRPPSGSAASAIHVRGARTHNLKGVDCHVPHRAVTVVTGPSGAGKSSLAFDTIYAEGQRRFVESMSTYARNFLEQMERPAVDSVDNILPAVALEAKNSIKNARSTVGTITETHDVLRLLFTHLGTVHCPEGHGPLRRWAAEEAADALAAGAAGERFLVVARIPRPEKKADEILDQLIRQGYIRRLREDRDGEIERLEPGARWWKKVDPMVLVLGRFKAGGEAGAGADDGDAGDDADADGTNDAVRAPTRLVETVEEAYRLGSGRFEAIEHVPVRLREAHAEGDRSEAAPTVRHFGRGLVCTECGTSVRTPTPPLFSFNSPLGACPECQGFGRVMGIDRARVVPDPTLPLEDKPLAPWNTPAYEEYYDELFAAAAAAGVPLDVAWEALTDEQRRWVWSGDGDFTNLDAFFAWLERKTYRVHVRVLLARYRSYDRCPVCDGERLKPEARAVMLEGENLPALTARSVEDLRAWLAGRTWSERQRQVAGHLIDELTERVEVLHRVGLDYLTLDRQARTLSGGESQRIHLAASLGSGLTSTLYVLDEPTIGLHPRDSDRLLALLHDLAERGNTVLVVEHDRTLIRGADHLIDLGPQAGEKGGELMAEGPVDDVLTTPGSLTAKYLRERPPTRAREHLARFRRESGIEALSDEMEGRPRVRIVGARAHNLRDLTVEFPLATLVAVTGVSGSGKSTLIENVLHGTYQRSQGVVDVEPGEVDALEGMDDLADVTLVDQSPLGRSSRSNPVTYLKIYDDIRKLMAKAPKARQRSVTPGHFSFNTDKGRCPVCKGTGELEVDMQFMAAVSVVCDECGGRRFKPEILAITWQGLTIHDILELTVDGAREVFAKKKKIRRGLEVLADVGLGYLRLGQSTATLSGGEAQRLKLAAFLDRPEGDEPHLFLFDEPTTGLHLSDIDLLYRTLRRLVQRGDGVVVVEHSEDLIARADWIVDLGPGGGKHGGDLLFSGPLETWLDRVDSPTAEALRDHLKWGRDAGG